MTTSTGSVVAGRQRVLRRLYRATPIEAISVKHVRTRDSTAGDPFHGCVEAVGDYPTTRWTFGLDTKVGGDDDLPNPGHLLCTALAACQDSTIRMLADLLGIELCRLEVAVTGRVDVRGCLAVDDRVRVGFSDIDVTVTIDSAPETDADLVRLLEETSARLCVNLDTLRRGVPVNVSFRHSTTGQ